MHSLEAGFGSGGLGNAGTKTAQINSSESDAQSTALLWHLFTSVLTNRFALPCSSNTL